MCESRVSDPLDDIEMIFEKIQKWKDTMKDESEAKKKAAKTEAEADKIPDFDQMVAAALKPKTVLKIHNAKTLMNKLRELAPAIGLTEDEIFIIVYTSIDHDYFTNLIVLQGEFLKWFNLDFSEATQEEMDFKDNKVEIWVATTTLAMEVTQWFGRINENHEVILTEKWWQKLRYFHFGNEMCEKFKNVPELMPELRELFKSQNDKLSYYDMFQFIKNKLEIELQNWEEDALEGRLDRLGMAFIEFNEFNEFSLEYGLNWKEPLAENDLEDILDAKINLSYKDYIVTEADYFQGCPTMLNNEKAALATVRKIYKSMKKANQTEYIDPHFGAKDKNDDIGHRYSLYRQGVVPQKGYPEPEKVEWAFAEQLCDSGEKV